MSAHCADCGFDLPYQGPCRYCQVKAEVEKLREALKQITAIKSVKDGMIVSDKGLELARKVARAALASPDSEAEDG